MTCTRNSAGIWIISYNGIICYTALTDFAEAVTYALTVRKLVVNHE